MSDSTPPENGPAPTPARAIYGFVLFVSGALAAVVYLVWALVPPAWLRALGLDYWPQQLWALTVPTALLAALLLFVLVVYPLLGLLGVPGLDDPRVHTDQHSLAARPTWTQRTATAAGGIPPVCDIPLSEVCRRLYLDSEGGGGGRRRRAGVGRRDPGGDGLAGPDGGDEGEPDLWRDWDRTEAGDGGRVGADELS